MVYQNQQNTDNQNPENLTEFFEEGLFDVDRRDHSFTNMLKGNLTSVIESKLIPYIIELFDRYSEEEFHKKMYNTYMHNGRMFTGFNFIADWKTNHRHYWKMFIGTVRTFHRFIRFNQESMVHKITTVMYMKGWTLSEYEIEGLRQTVSRIYNLMYEGKDL